MKYSIVEKGKTNWLFVAFFAFAALAAGAAVFYFTGQDINQDYSQSNLEVKKDIPNQMSEICDKKIIGHQLSDDEKKQCMNAGGEWNCGSVCVDDATSETENGCDDFCQCVCPKGRECIKQDENLIYGFDKCCEGLTKVLSHTTCATCETYTCVNCGDNVCGEWETAQNCPADCANSVSSCGNGKCDTGETVKNCDRDCADKLKCDTDVECVEKCGFGECVNRDWHRQLNCGGISRGSCYCNAGKCAKKEIACSDSKCETTCVYEGGRAGYYGRGGADGMQCCAGLIQIFSVSPNINGDCLANPVGFVICANCGNGICGKGENKCNCPKDCDTTAVN